MKARPAFRCDYQRAKKRRLHTIASFASEMLPAMMRLEVVNSTIVKYLLVLAALASVSPVAMPVPDRPAPIDEQIEQ
jgi:hypothetical protein